MDRQGWAAISEGVNSSDSLRLKGECEAAWEKGDFRRAGVGRGHPDWQPGDGGELKLWTTTGDRGGAFTLIEPRMGTLVCFMAGDFWHEVLPAKKTRMSITGWFRQR